MRPRGGVGPLCCGTPERKLSLLLLLLLATAPFAALLEGRLARSDPLGKRKARWRHSGGLYNNAHWHAVRLLLVGVVAVRPALHIHARELRNASESIVGTSVRAGVHDDGTSTSRCSLRLQPCLQTGRERQ